MDGLKRIALTVLAGWAVVVSSLARAEGTYGQPGSNPIRIHVVFNNVPYRAGLEASWGFACLIEGLERTLLFDTGGDGPVLLANVRRMGLDPTSVDVVVLSHAHADHTGGLEAFLARRPDVTAFVPASFPTSFVRSIERHGATVERVAGPQRLFDGVYSTGEMGAALKEQALILDTPQGLVVVTGCAHPNVAAMAEQARTYLGKDIYLVMGGFHLGSSSEADIRAIIGRLEALGVRKVAPSHCTGDGTIQMFRAAWGEDFVEGGLGAVIEVPDRP
ncbi:MAG: MBL fold metallo-hydrolase [Deinococcales bacterium]|jgi:7,8-dihydropterin-6-yl-methyl-4-(beta-D-ribofuranosyl)aminobenzene 5'-phosphate synthase